MDDGDSANSASKCSMKIDKKLNGKAFDGLVSGRYPMGCMANGNSCDGNKCKTCSLKNERPEYVFNEAEDDDSEEGKIESISPECCSTQDSEIISKDVTRKSIVLNLAYAEIVVAGKDNVVLSTDAESVSDNNLRNIISCNTSMFPDALKRSGSCAGKRYSIIMNKTRHLTDSGLGQKFFYLTNYLLDGTKKKGDLDLHVLTRQQQAIFYLYANQLEKAQAELESTIQLAEKCTNYSLLLGRSHTYIAYVLLYQCRYEAALENLEKAKYFLALCVSGEEKSMVCYLLGCVYMKMAANCSSRRGDYESKALEYFCLYVRHASEDSEQELRVKELQYGILKQVTVYLRTYTRESFKFPADKLKIVEAKELLDYFELNLWKFASPAAKVHYASLRSDYFFRNNCLERASEILTRSLKEAERIGHQPMIKMICDRINILTSTMEERT